MYKQPNKFAEWHTFLPSSYDTKNPVLERERERERERPVIKTAIVLPM